MSNRTPITHLIVADAIVCGVKARAHFPTFFASVDPDATTCKRCIAKHDARPAPAPAPVVTTVERVAQELIAEGHDADLVAEATAFVSLLERELDGPARSAIERAESDPKRNEHIWLAVTPSFTERFRATLVEAREHVAEIAADVNATVSMWRDGDDVTTIPACWSVTPSKPAVETPDAKVARLSLTPAQRSAKRDAARKLTTSRPDGTLTVDAAVALVIDASGNARPSFIAKETGLALSTVRHALNRRARVSA